MSWKNTGEVFSSALDYVLTPTLDSSLELAQADSQTLEAISKACKI